MIGRSRSAEPAPVEPQSEAERIAALEEQVRILTGRRVTEEAHEEARVALTLVGPNGHRQPSAVAQKCAAADAAAVAARVAAHEAAQAESDRLRAADAGPRGRLEERVAELTAQHTEALVDVAEAQARADTIDRDRATAMRQLGEREASYRVEPTLTPSDAAERDALKGIRPPDDDGHILDAKGRRILRADVVRPAIAHH
jgi:hypothetical protein